MNILYEDTMPHAGDYFSTLGNTNPYSWQTLTPDDLVDVDVFAVRSTTKITPDLLSKANQLRLIATATAGTNHMNIGYLDAQNIEWYAAGGCNAVAVAQYVVSALMFAHEQGDLNYHKITVGIVGAGNVGSALARMFDALSIRYVLCDPLIEATDPRQFVTLDEALQCDVVSLHVPYTRDGLHPTEKMISAERLQGLTAQQWLINGCRGEVIDEAALLALKQVQSGPQLVLDVWQNEPDIDTELMSFARLATPHIAGHTDEGKIRGTQMVYDHVLSAMNELTEPSKPLSLEQFLPALQPIQIDPSNFSLSQFLLSIYDIRIDHRIFIENMAESKAFSSLRKQYRGRREYSAYTIANGHALSDEQQSTLRKLGFSLL